MGAMFHEEDVGSSSMLGEFFEAFHACPKSGHHLDSDDLPSTATPSVMHSPECRPHGQPEDIDHLCEGLLEHALTMPHVEECDSAAKERAHELRRQVERYLSAESLSHDRYLCSRMDGCGWLPLGELAGFAALRCSDASVAELAEAAQPSREIEVSADRRSVRCADPALREAFPAVRRGMIVANVPSPEVDFADEDLTIAAVLESPSPGGPRRASKEGAPWPCMEWLTADPYVTESCLEWLSTEAADDEIAPRSCRRRRHGGRRSRGNRRCTSATAEAESEAVFEGPEVGDSPAAAGWLRFSDDGYPSAAASLLQW
eukprot:CAMPEP_0170201706 /NCGR_PEP_ID=MMETSP0116_2-20130129/312_1 /TAXON_ID=400756 /ORGANISM="Durinskia baltica, Strain CSIRO CS-38" /LENGTH=315 /DNA_ID=CAMNT_0010451927 /DNA_START=76 /DNA_END=1023 /DNA_ORIENTATION=+